MLQYTKCAAGHDQGDSNAAEGPCSTSAALLFINLVAAVCPQHLQPLCASFGGITISRRDSSDRREAAMLAVGAEG
jgi:hypothetical protein